MSYMIAVLAIAIADYRNLLLANGDFSDYAELCPYNNMCNSPASKIINESNLIPCCQKCSCASDCHMVGNCCPDVQTDNVTEPKYPCKDIFELINSGRGIKFRTFFKLSFHIIDSCPDKRSEDAFPACMNPVEMKDFVIVSNKADDKVFKNHQCAMCNGIYDFVVWDIYTPCPQMSDVMFESFDERNRFILNECLLVSLPPGRRIVEKTLCLNEYNPVGKCYSGDVSDELKRACETKRPLHNTAFHVQPEGRTFVYMNIYCYLCNKAEHASVVDICSSSGLFNGRLTNLPEFTVLLNLNTEDAKTETIQCVSSDIWDPFDKICRRLHCQTGSIPFNGVCKRSFATSQGHAVQMLFEVKSNHETEENESLMNFLVEELYRFVGGHTFNCGECFSYMYSLDNRSEMLLEWPLYTTEMCPKQLILSFADRLARKGQIRFRYGYPERSVNISLKLSFVTPKGRRMVASLKTKPRRGCYGKMQLLGTMLQNCPRIELSTKEVSGLNVSQESQQEKIQWMLIENKLTNKTSICVKRYFQLRKLANSGQDNLLSPRDWLIVASVCVQVMQCLLKYLFRQ